MSLLPVCVLNCGACYLTARCSTMPYIVLNK